ncbi:MAG: hypothetical protein PHI27_06990 [Eubacteriales bacterium]|nr:hypothetical protein [Eubacteriales bacterium]MDD3881981.1 hypothetical protein [Eubacteriales bacterium]MDD4513118.1 hypothetical protein [Eubacteriales bacterium]
MLYNEGRAHLPNGCAISGIIDTSGGLFSGSDIIESIALMHERSNGLGGGFAAYGIYPDHPDEYAIHVFYDDLKAQENVEAFLEKHFLIMLSERIPTRKNANIVRSPIIWRYFAQPLRNRVAVSGYDEEEYVARCVIHVNNDFDGAFVFSSGINMGAFKGVGYPEDIGEFYMLDNYHGYSWTAHGRFPTNTPGWWGGAHPFTLLDFSIVHNGEISSYDANRRYIEMYDYHCSLMTDTEVMTYLADMILRRHALPIHMLPKIFAAPMWEEIARMDDKSREEYETLRAVYAGALINGPFSIILGFNGGFMALNDRLKLRSMVTAKAGSKVYVASEESAIRRIEKNLDEIWTPRGGEPVIALVDENADIGRRRRVL